MSSYKPEGARATGKRAGNAAGGSCGRRTLGLSTNSNTNASSPADVDSAANAIGAAEERLRTLQRPWTGPPVGDIRGVGGNSSARGVMPRRLHAEVARPWTVPSLPQGAAASGRARASSARGCGPPRAHGQGADVLDSACTRATVSSTSASRPLLPWDEADDFDMYSALPGSGGGGQRPWSPSRDANTRHLTLQPGSETSRWNHCLADVQIERRRESQLPGAVAAAAAAYSNVIGSLTTSIGEVDKDLGNCWQRSADFGVELLKKASSYSGATSPVRSPRAKKKHQRPNSRRRRDDEVAVYQNQAGAGFENSPLAQRHFALKVSLGGNVKRAADALERSDIKNVHGVPEVMKIYSSIDRVGAKVEYFRDQDALGEALVARIEKDFMVKSQGKDTSAVVCVGKLLQHRTGGGSGSASGAHREETVPGGEQCGDDRLGYTSGVSRCTRGASCGGSRAEQIREVIDRARNIDLEKRVTAYMKLQQRNSRHQEAARAKPWASWIVVVAVMLRLRYIGVAYQRALESAKKAATERKENEDGSWRLRIAVQPLQDPLPGRGNLGLANFMFLSSTVLDVINRRVMRNLLDQDQTLRKNRMWMQWRHIFRILVAAARFVKPIRRHKQMDMIKDFIESSWNVVRVRRSISGFVQKASLLQQVSQITCRIGKLTKDHIILPQIWALEAILISEAVGLSVKGKNRIQPAVNAYLESCSLDKWHEKVQELCKFRHNVLRSETFSLKKAMAAHQRDAGHARRRHYHSKVEDNADGDDAPVQRESSQRRRDGNVKGQANDTSEAASREQSKALLMSMDGYRLTDDQRAYVASLVHQSNVQTWWKAYQSYKTDVVNNMQLWAQWRMKIIALGRENEQVWPEPPPVLPYPTILGKVNRPIAKQFLLQQLRQSPQSAALFS
eukprot:TRINITY_DN38075_c0_g1_i1.p1 TRINITY_DN38075_c0_g1~~TRINITY_DN38075_c0_g1_i1.p1  ORF type:complete len:933 (-),score=163.51 TRINITY_DN38075_c0_g1_i1:115-2826(-)